MITKQLMTVINGYKTIMKEFSVDTENDDYECAFDQLYNGALMLIDALLKNAVYAFINVGEGYVGIFSTSEERGAFIDKFDKELCHPITYEEFEEYAQGEDVIPNCYRFDKEHNFVAFDRTASINT